MVPPPCCRPYCRRGCCWSRSLCCRSPCRCRGGIPGEGAVGHGQRAVALVDAAAVDAGRIAGEGAVGHGQRAVGVVDAAAVQPAVLPERVLLVTVSVPVLSMPPPLLPAVLPERVRLVSRDRAGVVVDAAAGSRPCVLPWRTVTPSSARLPVEATSKTR